MVIFAVPALAQSGSSQQDLAQSYLDQGRAYIESHPDSTLYYTGMANALSAEHDLPYISAQSAQLMGRVYFWKGEQERARKLFADARATLQKTNASKDVIAESFLKLADMERLTRNFKQALDLTFEVNELYSEEVPLESSPSIEASTISTRGAIFQDLGSYDLALDDYRSALAIYESLPDSVGISRTYGRIGKVMFAMGNYNEALANFQPALDIQTATANTMGIMMSRCQMGLVELKRGFPDKAKQAHHESLNLARSVGMNRGIANNMQYLGEIFLETDQPDSALHYFQQAYDIWAQPGIKGRMAVTALGKARALFVQGKNRRALGEANLAARYATESELKKTRAEALELVSEIYEVSSNFRQSLAAQREAKKIQAEILAEEQAGKQTELKVRFEHQAAVAKLEAEKEVQDGDLVVQGEALRQNRLVTASLIGGIVLVLFLAGVLINNLRANRKQNLLLETQGKEIQEKNEELNKIQKQLEASNVNLEGLVDERTDALKEAVTELMAVNDELDTFIYRASHDLMGPIARLRGLSLLLRSGAANGQSSPYIDLIDSVSIYMDRVLRKLILVHDIRKPRKQENGTGIPELLESIEYNLKDIPGLESPQVIFETKGAGFVPFSQKLLHIALENVIENACIFRKMEKGNSPTIHVRSFLEDQNLIIEVEDEGIGIPEEIRDQVFGIFFRGSERSKGNGLGLHLVTMAIEAMGGSVSLTSQPNVFTLVRMNLPVDPSDLRMFELQTPSISA